MQESHDNKRVKRNFEDMMTLSEKADYFGFLQYELNRCNCKVSLKSEEIDGSRFNNYLYVLFV